MDVRGMRNKETVSINRDFFMTTAPFKYFGDNIIMFTDKSGLIKNIHRG
jgi:hypothetical protein